MDKRIYYLACLVIAMATVFTSESVHSTDSNEEGKAFGKRLRDFVIRISDFKKKLKSEN